MLALALIVAAAPSTLPDVHERLEKERSAALELAGRESSLLGRLADLERQIELGGRALHAAEIRLKAANARLAVVEERRRKADERLSTKLDALEPRLLARYKLGREGYLRFILGAKSIGDVLRRKRLFDALLQEDLAALADLRFEAQGAKAARDELAAAQAEVAASVAAENEKRTALEARIEQQRAVLASVRDEKSLHEEAARELEDAEKQLDARLSDLSARRARLIAPEIRLDIPSPRRQRGKLIFPVAHGKVEVHYGRSVDPRFGIVSVQNGIDVRAAPGTPVRAVWPGKVVHAGWFKGYGNLLIVDHGDGIFSLMAHLDTLERAVGDVLAQGDEVGTVGDTGSLKGFYLYFELRDGQKALDPERWLSRRRAAQLVAGNKGRP